MSNVIAEKSQASKTAVLSQLMRSIAEDNYKAFVSRGNAQFKQGISQQAFNSVVKQYAGYLQSGYKATYLDTLIQQGNKVHLWKISYQGRSENTLAKLVIIDNKVAGFWLL